MPARILQWAIARVGCPKVWRRRLAGARKLDLGGAVLADLSHERWIDRGGKPRTRLLRDLASMSSVAPQSSLSARLQAGVAVGDISTVLRWSGFVVPRFHPTDLLHDGGSPLKHTRSPCEAHPGAESNSPARAGKVTLRALNVLSLDKAFTTWPRSAFPMCHDGQASVPDSLLQQEVHPTRTLLC